MVICSLGLSVFTFSICDKNKRQLLTAVSNIKFENSQIEKSIKELEEENAQLKKDIITANFSIKNHIHQQYYVVDDSNYVTSEVYHHNHNMVRIKPINEANVVDEDKADNGLKSRLFR